MKLVVTPRAQRHQDDISKYTLSNWGREQLLSYVGGLLDRLDTIAADPEIGRGCPSYPTGFGA